MNKKKATKRELANFCRYIAAGFTLDSYFADPDCCPEVAKLSPQLWKEVDDIINLGLKEGWLFPYSDAARPEVAKAWREVARRLDHGMKVDQ